MTQSEEVPRNVFKDPTPAPEPKTVRKELKGSELEQFMDKTEMERWEQLKDWGFNLKKPITVMDDLLNGRIIHQEES